MIPLSPDLVARAVVASARSYGDDPIYACTAKRGVMRRSLKAAAMGLHAAMGGDLSRYCKVLRISDKNLYHARRGAKEGAPILVAAAAAERAVSRSRGADALKDPPRPQGQANSNLRIKSALEGSLPAIFEAHPRGANAAQAALICGLEEDEVSRAAPWLYADHKCRWQKIPGSGRRKVIVPWTDQPPAPAKPVIRASMRGRISSAVAPNMSRREIPQPVGIRGRVLSQLRFGAMNTISLATLIDAKELAVSECLRGLQIEGLVEAGPMPEEGRRHQTWRLTQEQAA